MKFKQKAEEAIAIFKQEYFACYQPRTRETRASNATPPPPPDTGSNAVKPSPELKIILDMMCGKEKGKEKENDD
jgi:hypothetical protein